MVSFLLIYVSLFSEISVILLRRITDTYEIMTCLGR